jgi:hypothetical protein
VNNAPKHLAKFPLGIIIIWRIWNEYSMLVLNYLMGRRIKHCWLIMNLPKWFRILSELVFFLNHSKDKCCQRTRCDGWTSHHIVTTFAWIAFSRNNLSSLWSYG